VSVIDSVKHWLALKDAPEDRIDFSIPGNGFLSPSPQSSFSERYTTVYPKLCSWTGIAKHWLALKDVPEDRVESVLKRIEKDRNGRTPTVAIINKAIHGPTGKTQSEPKKVKNWVVYHQKCAVECTKHAGRRAQNRHLRYRGIPKDPRTSRYHLRRDRPNLDLGAQSDSPPNLTDQRLSLTGQIDRHHQLVVDRHNRLVRMPTSELHGHSVDHQP
jgi:hypothetical protein